MKSREFLYELFKQSGSYDQIKSNMKSRFISSTLIKFIESIDTNNEVDMVETFKGVLSLADKSKGFLNEEDTTSLFLSVIYKLESIQDSICPVLSDGTLKFDIRLYTGINDLIELSKEYIRYNQETYISIDDNSKHLVNGFYKYKTAVMRNSLNTLGELCPTL